MDKETSIGDFTSARQFVPGAIHDEAVRDFWASHLNANAWVMDTLKSGYVLPFHSVPAKQELRNNLSARKEKVFVQQEVEKLRDQGVVLFCDTPAEIVSPLTVAINSAGKKRLCLDLSRTVNEFITVPSVSLADLRAALQLTESGDWQGVYDLASAYHHIKIFPGHVKYLGAAYEKPDGSKQYFVYLYLPFGLASAVHVMTKVMKPVSAFIAAQGIRHTIYLDDGRVVAGSKLQAAQDLGAVFEILAKAGWYLAPGKSDSPDTISQTKKYLGFVIDTEDMSVKLTEAKEEQLRQEVASLIARNGKKIKAKELAKILGKMVSSTPALGEISLIFARPAYAVLEKRVDTFGWSCWVRISPDIATSLTAFLNNIAAFNGNPISHTDKAISLLSLIGPPDRFFSQEVLPNHVPDLPKEIFVSDASNVAVCSYSISDTKPFFFIGKLDQKEMGLSSGHRELLAVKMALKARQDTTGPWAERTNIFWLTDSENMVVFLNKGSPKKHIQQVVLEIMKLSKELRIVLLPIHLRREDPRIKMADAGSRVRDSDDWSLDAISFQNIEDQFGPFTVDLFADSSNAKTQKFYSNFLCPQTSGVNAFSLSWDGENAWICPPVASIVKVVRKIRFSKLTAVLVIPAWKSADFWPLIFPRQQEHPTFVKRVLEINPTIIQNQRACSPLVGKTPYSFLLIIIDSL